MKRKTLVSRKPPGLILRQLAGLDGNGFGGEIAADSDYSLPYSRKAMSSE